MSSLIIVKVEKAFIVVSACTSRIVLLLNKTIYIFSYFYCCIFIPVIIPTSISNSVKSSLDVL